MHNNEQVLNIFPKVTSDNATDSLILALISVPKTVDNKRKVKPVLRQNFKTYKYSVSSDDGNHKFFIIIKDHLVLPNKFSVILNYEAEDSRSGVNLFRCNSPHTYGPTSHYDFHIHTLMAEDWQVGKTQHQRKTESAKYRTISGAIKHFIEFCSVQDTRNVFEDFIGLPNDPLEKRQISLDDI